MSDGLKTVEELKEQVLLFNMLKLPGQPQGMHMGTSYLVNDLLRRVEAQDKVIADLIVERDKARDHGYDARVREKAAENARVSVVERLTKLEVEVKRHCMLLQQALTR